MKDVRKLFNLVTLGTILVDVILIVMSVFFIYFPTVGTESALLILGIVLLISGIYSIIKFILNSKSFFKFELVYGILSIVCGALAILKPFEITNFITILVGIWLLISSLIKLPIIIELRKFKEDSWIFDFSILILTLLLAILLLINPFNGYIILSTYAAIMIIVYAASDILEQLFLRKRASKIIDFFK